MPMFEQLNDQLLVDSRGVIGVPNSCPYVKRFQIRELLGKCSIQVPSLDDEIWASQFWIFSCCAALYLVERNRYTPCPVASWTAVWLIEIAWNWLFSFIYLNLIYFMIPKQPLCKVGFYMLLRNTVCCFN